jgi:hypothetical protein
VPRITGKRGTFRLRTLAKAPQANPDPVGQRRIRYAGAFHEAKVYRRDDLLSGHRLEGPAIVEQFDTTTVVAPGFRGEVDDLGVLMITPDSMMKAQDTGANALLTNPILLEVLMQRFRAVAEEMGYALQRTGYTAFVNETADLGVALVTPKGEIFGYPVSIGISMFANLAFGAVIDSFDNYQDGDVVFYNDPLHHGRRRFPPARRQHADAHLLRRSAGVLRVRLRALHRRRWQRPGQPVSDTQGDLPGGAADYSSEALQGRRAQRRGSASAAEQRAGAHRYRGRPDGHAHRVDGGRPTRAGARRALRDRDLPGRDERRAGLQRAARTAGDQADHSWNVPLLRLSG